MQLFTKITGLGIKPVLCNYIKLQEKRLSHSVLDGVLVNTHNLSQFINASSGYLFRHAGWGGMTLSVFLCTHPLESLSIAAEYCKSIEYSLSRGSPDDKCRLECSFRSFKQHAHILCCFDVHSNPHTCWKSMNE
jgi:hypothetical protein